jgi:hypothetical protein
MKKFSKVTSKIKSNSPSHSEERYPPRYRVESGLSLKNLDYLNQ